MNSGNDPKIVRLVIAILGVVCVVSITASVVAFIWAIEPDKKIDASVAGFIMLLAGLAGTCIGSISSLLASTHQPATVVVAPPEPTPPAAVGGGVGAPVASRL